MGGRVQFDPIITVTLNPTIDRVLEVDGFRIGAHQLGRERLRTAAGKGINVSRALGRLGVQSIATGFVGHENAAQFESLLTGGERDLAARINLQFFDVPGQVRENITIIDTADGGETHVRDTGPSIAEKDLVRMKRKLDLMSREGALVVFGGGLPPGVTEEQFVQLVHICIGAGAKVAVDTSRAALHAVRDDSLFLIKPNISELSELLGRDVPDEQDALVAAGRELAAGYQYVLISRGAEGALAFNGKEALVGRVPLESDRVVSTVGCGDCLLAGFVAALVHGRDFREAFVEGLAVATANVTRDGPAQFDLGIVYEFRQAAEVVEAD